MDADGQNPRRLFDNKFVTLGKMEESKDGRYLAILEEGDYIGAVWVFDRENNELRKITEGSYESDTFSWSPAPGHIITAPYVDPATGQINLWSFNLDDGTQTRIAQHDLASSPAWSPNRNGLAYVVPNYNADTMQVRNERLRQTLKFPYARDQGFSPFEFDWYGRKIVFSSAVPDSEYPEYANSFIQIIDEDGNLIQITH